MISSKQVAVPTANPPQLPTPESLPTVYALAPIKPPGGWAAAALGRDRGSREVGAEVIEVGAASAMTAGGVGLLDAESLALLWWSGLAGVELPTTISLPDLPVGAHWLVTAADQRAARFSYLTRQRLQPGGGDDQDVGVMQVDASAYEVTLTLSWPSLADPSPPFAEVTLTRPNDPDWRYRPGGSQVERLPRPQTNQRVFVLRGLGPGDYQLAVESGDGEVFAEDVSRLAFTLPGVDEISVRCRRR